MSSVSERKSKVSVSGRPYDLTTLRSYGLRVATDADWFRFFGVSAPGCWVGLVSDGGWLIHGMGGALLGIDDRWWIFFQRTPGVRMTKTAHTAARVLLEVFADDGLRVHALPDRRMAGAELWLKRLGFEATAEQMDGVTVWIR